MGEGRGKGENTHGCSQRTLATGLFVFFLLFFPLIVMETNFQYVDIGQFSYPLCLVSDISHEVEFGFILKLCVLVWSSIALGMAPHFYFKKKKR